jgi:AcrR family transcriptional regulator
MEKFMSDTDRKKKPAARAPSLPPRRTQAERTQATRKLILDATIHILARKGAAGLRIADVAKEAGLSIGAQLHHFPAKEDLICGAFDYVNERAMELSVQRVRFARRANNSKSVIDGIVADGSDFFFGHGFFIELALAFTKSDPQLRKAVRKSSRHSRFFIEDLWKEALCERGVPPEIASDVLALTLSIVRGFAMRRFLEDDPARRATLLRTWNDMICAYLMSRLNGAQITKIYSEPDRAREYGITEVAALPLRARASKTVKSKRAKGRS